MRDQRKREFSSRHNLFHAAKKFEQKSSLKIQNCLSANPTKALDDRGKLNIDDFDFARRNLRGARKYAVKLPDETVRPPDAKICVRSGSIKLRVPKPIRIFLFELFFRSASCLKIL